MNDTAETNAPSDTGETVEEEKTAEVEASEESLIAIAAKENAAENAAKQWDIEPPVANVAVTISDLRNVPITSEHIASKLLSGEGLDEPELRVLVAVLSDYTAVSMAFNDLAEAYGVVAGRTHVAMGMLSDAQMTVTNSIEGYNPIQANVLLSSDEDRKQLGKAVKKSSSLEEMISSVLSMGMRLMGL